MNIKFENKPWFQYGLGTEKELTMLITLDEIIELFYKKLYIKFL